MSYWRAFRNEKGRWLEMADERKLTVGLTPRPRPEGVARNLSAAMRNAQPAAVKEHEEVAGPAATKSAITPTKSKKPTTTKKVAADGVKVPFTVNIPAELHGRARAAFRHAQFHERVATFGDFVANALEAEVSRIEKEHNGGNRFEPEHENLPRGRKSSK